MVEEEGAEVDVEEVEGMHVIRLLCHVTRRRQLRDGCSRCCVRGCGGGGSEATKVGCAAGAADAGVSAGAGGSADGGVDCDHRVTFKNAATFDACVYLIVHFPAASAAMAVASRRQRARRGGAHRSTAQHHFEMMVLSPK